MAVLQISICKTKANNSHTVEKEYAQRFAEKYFNVKQTEPPHLALTYKMY